MLKYDPLSIVIPPTKMRI